MENVIAGNGTANDGIIKNGVCSSESDNGSCDVWSCKDSDSSSADHLVIMVHGILGSASDWKFAAEQFVRMLPDKVIVHCSERNVSRLTLDGVDVMGERLAEEVLQVIQRKPNLRKISFIAHSVGGLVARYAIGRLYRLPQKENLEDSAADAHEEDLKATIGGLEAINFITVATPHLGSRWNKQVCFVYIQASCCVFKYIVGWRTSSIRRDNKLPKWEDYVNEKYPHIVYEERCKASDAEQSDLVTIEDNYSDKLEEELVTGLSRLSWEKVDVSFHTCRQRFAAHSVIQVKDHIMHMEGADVIQHLIDHFLV
ncbi:uncharacterized protein LOC110669558 isoform X2 [Hevea brasiliensis]|uniref:uncharacterized protein LOC110669558 isoform X2 n=1 Tax=Hevea brasiliensis TaxID=3981 RepID=UPI0025F60F68|nr:uncharacterized protein LOC110669558 isoform X2 [Hevea brasiliensis]